MLSLIEAKGWWQGSVVSASVIPVLEYASNDFWVVASQACNLYANDFVQLPWVELVGANLIPCSEPSKSKGDHPRILHIQANGTSGSPHLQIDITLRKWIQRSFLAEISPEYSLSTLSAEKGITCPNDILCGWLARSYTRVALPNDFNRILQEAKIGKLINDKLAKHADKLYGIYFSIESEIENETKTAIGKLPPPYLLSIVIVVNEDVDGEAVCKPFIDGLFAQNTPDPRGEMKKVSRADLARRYGIRLIEEDVRIMNMAEITLLELRGLVRYTFVDYLSDSGFSAAN